MPSLWSNRMYTDLSLKTLGYGEDLVADEARLDICELFGMSAIELEFELREWHTDLIEPKWELFVGVYDAADYGGNFLFMSGR